MSTKHTPTPWMLGSTAEDGKLMTLIEAAGGYIAVCDMGVDDEKDVANAAFIVRAVNAHDELIALLRHCRDRFNHMTASGASQRDLDNQLRSAIDVALTKPTP